MNRINTVFRRQKSAFISYLVCGDPDLNTTLKIMHSMVKNGVDLIEVGIPFTDPIADGPVIQKGIERALKNKVSLIDVFDLVEKFGSLENAFRNVDSRFLILSISSDWLYPPQENEDIASCLMSLSKDVTYLSIDSDYGHDAFLAEQRKFSDFISFFLKGAS